jgi:hypothetical protein
MPRPGADPSCVDGGVGRFGHRRFLGPAGCPIAGSQFPDSRESNREFAKFPVVSVIVGVKSCSNFNRLQGIRCYLRRRRIPKQFQRLAGASLLFTEQGIVSSEQGIGIPSPVPWVSAAGAQISRFDRFGILYPLACAGARHESCGLCAMRQVLVPRALPQEADASWSGEG